MNPIDEKYRQLGSSSILLGAPVESIQMNPDNVGSRRKYEHGFIYYHPSTGANVVTQEIFDYWQTLVWEQGPLGYPTQDTNVDGPTKYGLFQFGSISMIEQPLPLTFFGQNMKLLVFPAVYDGIDRGAAINALINFLRIKKPDIVGLSEMWDNGERDTIKSQLHDIYPYVSKKLDDDSFWDFESDGGLLLMSMYPIIDCHQTIYRVYEGEEAFANKGAIHALIEINHDTRYDIFLTHTQNPDPKYGSHDKAVNVLKFELTILSNFIKSCGNPERPAILFGDLNLDAFINDDYQDFLNRLDYPDDNFVNTGKGVLAFVNGSPTDHHLNSRGITSDTFNNHESFTIGNVPIDSPKRFQEGTRIDFILTYKNKKTWPVFDYTKVVVIQLTPGTDISDHYGLVSTQKSVRRYSYNINADIISVKVEFIEFLCLTQNEDTLHIGDFRPGDGDEVFFTMTCSNRNGEVLSKRIPSEGKVKNVSSASFHEFNIDNAITLTNVKDGLLITVKGAEDDNLGNQNLGERSISINRQELLSYIKNPTIRALPVLSDDGEYIAKVKISVEANLLDIVNLSDPPRNGIMEAIENADGRLEVSYIGNDDTLYHNWQVTPNSGWAGKSLLETVTNKAKALTLARSKDGRLEIIYAGTDQKLYHNWQVSPGGGWHGQTLLGATTNRAQSIKAAQNSDGNLDVFYIGTNDQLYHNWFNGTKWTGESPLVAAFARDITIGRNKDKHLEVFYIGTDRRLYHASQAPSGWLAPMPFASSATLAKSLQVAGNADGRLEVFFIGTDDHLYHKWQVVANGNWSAESLLCADTIKVKGLCVAQNRDGRLEIFYIGIDDRLYHKRQTAPNSGWEEESVLGNATTKARALTSGLNQDGRLEVFFQGLDNRFYHIWQITPNGLWGEAALFE